MYANLCTFPKINDGTIEIRGEKCALYFRSLNELVHHIEEEHIPIIEARKMAELKQLKDQYSNDPEQYEKAYTAFLNQPIPLSLVCRLKPFPKGYKVHPVPAPKQRSMKFSYCKPKQHVFSGVPPKNVTGTKTIPQNLDQNQPTTSNIQKKFLQSQSYHHPSRLHKTSTSSESAAFEIGVGGQEQGIDRVSSTLFSEERRFRCDVGGCGKAYKNQQGLRSHMKNTHNMSGESTFQLIPTKLSASEEGILNRHVGKHSPLRTDQIRSIDNVGTIFSASTPNARHIETKHQCQHCGKGYKTQATLNKHLIEQHNIIIASPSSSVQSSRYPSPSPLGSQQQQPHQLYSPQQSPQRPFSTSGSISLISAVKSAVPPSNVPSQTAFMAPTITARHHQQPIMVSHQIARPSAPIPAHTPPLASANSHTSFTFSQQHNRGLVQHTEVQPRQIPGEQQQMLSSNQGPHYFVSTNSVDQQPPVLQPQQQPSAPQRYRYTYQTQTTQSLVQRPQEQQIYSSSAGGTQFAYGGAAAGSQPLQQTGTTIYMTQQQGTTEPSAGHQHCTVQPMEVVDYQQQSAPRYYNRQPHYTVEPISEHSGVYSPHSVSQIQPPGNRSTPATTTIRVSTGQPHYVQPNSQQQHHFHTVYRAGTGSNVYYQNEPSQQHPSYATTIRTAPIQAPQRAYVHQQQSQHTHGQQHRTYGQRESPATVAAVLGDASVQSQVTNTGSYAQQPRQLHHQQIQ